MEIIKEKIDNVLESLLSPDRLKSYEKWVREYKSRMFDSIQYEIEPYKNTKPTFETNLICYLFEDLKGRDPHCEWAYEDYVKESGRRVSRHADIVFIQPTSDKPYEVWIEVKMYLGITSKYDRGAYRKDFEKLKSIVSKNTHRIGVLVHFDLKTGKRDFFEYFELLKKNICHNYIIDNRIIGDANSFHIVRLILKQK